MPNNRPHDRFTMSYQRIIMRICLVLLLLRINDAFDVNFTSQRLNNVYVENGDDQTAINKLTITEKLTLEDELLKVLGISDKPKSTNGKAALIKRLATKFLLAVYENKANQESEEKPNESVQPLKFNLTENDLVTIDQSDVIITFTARQSHQGVEDKPDRVTRVWFNVDAVPPDNQIISADLRLYRDPNAKSPKNREAFTVMAHRVLPTKNGEIEMQFVDSANTTGGDEGWMTLNVTESLLHWMKHPDDNKGLYLSIRPIDRLSDETRPEDIGIVGFEGDAEHQPFMAGFFRSNKSDKVEFIQSTPQSSENDNKRNKKRHTSNQTSYSSCKIGNLYVSFKDLLWLDWIIAPAGFDVNYCSGRCDFPLNNQMNATNHAMVQAITNAMYPEKMRKPCCVPTKLSAIDVLYYLDDNTVILRKWKNMSAQSCGCH